MLPKITFRYCFSFQPWIVQLLQMLLLYAENNSWFQKYRQVAQFLQWCALACGPDSDEMCQHGWNPSTTYSLLYCLHFFQLKVKEVGSVAWTYAWRREQCSQSKLCFYFCQSNFHCHRDKWLLEPSISMSLQHKLLQWSLKGNLHGYLCNIFLIHLFFLRLISFEPVLHWF